MLFENIPVFDVEDLRESNNVSLKEYLAPSSINELKYESGEYRQKKKNRETRTHTRVR
jgi:hypothetical protein